MMNRFLSLRVVNVWRCVRLSVALSGLLGLSACMVGPDYVRPTIDVGVQLPSRKVHAHRCCQR